MKKIATFLILLFVCFQSTLLVGCNKSNPCTCNKSKKECACSTNPDCNCNKSLPGVPSEFKLCNTVIVSKDGTGDYTSVVEAVAKTEERTVIYIMPGVYVGTIQAFTKEIILIGVNKDRCILKSTDGRYSHPVINMSCGYIANLTLYSEYKGGVSNEISTNSGAYAIHCEHEYGVGKSLNIYNCNLKSDFFPAIGAGLRKDFTLSIENCTLENAQIVGRGNYSTPSAESEGSLGAVYIHDSAGAEGTSYFSMKNCVLKSSLGNTFTPYSHKPYSNNKVYCELINNVLYDKLNGITNNIWYRGDSFNHNFYLKPTCYGNSNNELNF